MDDANQFGKCCKDLSDALHAPNSLLRIDAGVLYASVGFTETKEGTGWYELAMIYCPFCGVQLQTREAIKKKTETP